MKTQRAQPYSISFAPIALKALEKLKKTNRIILKSITDSIKALASNPRPQGVEKLAGIGNAYRIRDGEYRIVYEIDDAKRTVVIFRIADRKDVYRK